MEALSQSRQPSPEQVSSHSSHLQVYASMSQPGGRHLERAIDKKQGDSERATLAEHRSTRQSSHSCITRHPRQSSHSCSGWLSSTGSLTEGGRRFTMSISCRRSSKYVSHSGCAAAFR